MPNIGPTELVIVLVIALLVLGPKPLPAAGRSLGHGIREFKESITGASGQGRTTSRSRPLRLRTRPGADSTLNRCPRRCDLSRTRIGRALSST
jgi:sec-independent protein translocase protein TatA